MVKIGVIGAGAVGGYYGAMLARAGHEVHFLLRRDLDAVRANGLDIRSWQGDFRLEDVNAAASPEEIGECDWVICSLKATALDEARELVGPCIGPETGIVALMNGLGVEDRFAAWFGGERVYGAMAFVCINRGLPGVIHHLDYGRVTVGHYRDDPDRVAALHDLFAGPGIETVASPSLLRARWEKLCWNIPFNGSSVAAGGVGTATILADAILSGAAEAAMREVVEAANADLAASGSDEHLVADDVVAAMFAQTATMGDYRTSMVIDYVSGRPMEVDAILGEPVRRARAHGLHLGAMELLYAAVHAADRRVRGEIAPLPPATLTDPARSIAK
jgi:2-dehydropantoate 2-reductase